MMRSAVSATLFLALLASCADAYWRNEGRQFQLNFPPTFNWGSTGTCQLSIASRFSGNVRVEAGFLLLNETRALTPFTRTVYDLAGTSRPVGVGLDNEAVYIYSDVDIAVIAYNYVPSTGTTGGQRAAYLLAPVTAEDSYVIHSHFDSHSGTSPHGFYTVVATDDNTQVVVYSPLPAGGYTFRESFNLNKGQCYNNISSLTEDISGVKLVASNPISVVSGHSNIKLSLETAWRTQFIGSAAFPVRALGTHYVVPGIAGGDPIECLIRVIAVASGNTSVTHNGANNVDLGEGEVTTFTRADKTQASTIVCSQPCSVAIYTYQDNTGNYAGSFQLPVVPETAFTSGGLVVITPNSADVATNHYLGLVVEGTDTSGIQLNGATVSTTWVQVAVPGGLTYSFGTVTITSGAHSLTSGTKRLAAYVYGHFTVDSSRGMSYAYPAGFDDIAYVTTPAPTTTAGPGTTLPPNDNRPAPGYEFTLHGDFNSLDLSTGQLGEPFTTACLNTYSLALATRANNIGVTVNNKVGIDICFYLAPDDIRIESSNVRMATNFSDARYGASEIDYITSSKNHLKFEDSVSCAQEMAEYLKWHSNWGQPILPSEPGCPFVNYTRNFFDITMYQWYCGSNTGAGEINLPNYAFALYSNFTSYNGDAVTAACTTAYSNQLERQAQDQLVYINNQIGVSVCTNISSVSLLRYSTIFTASTATTGGALVTFYLSTTNSAMRYIDLMVCADEIAQQNGPLSQWGQPLLNQEPGCPLLQFNDPFVTQDKYWFCYT